MIDLNCDVAEGLGNEFQLFPFISSCNIACGGHAGDKDTMKEVLALAKNNNVKVGAHPSYPDRENFGRISMKLSDQELITSIQKQIELLSGLCKEDVIELHHIKPHGALYNDIVKDEHLANVFLKSIAKYRETLFVYVPFGSEIERVALKSGFNIKREAFGDRNYNTDLSLVSRNEVNALITSPNAVLEHIVSMVKNNKVKTISGEYVEIKADTYCIHGDTSSALQILMYLSKELPN